jgi:hypothetical protein
MKALIADSSESIIMTTKKEQLLRESFCNARSTLSSLLLLTLVNNFNDLIYDAGIR